MEFLNKLKQEELNILNYVTNICNEYNINYFLLGGTLLGAVTHKGFIPWDDDIDIGMFREDYDKFQKVFKNNDKYILDSLENNSLYWLPYMKVRRIDTEYIENLLTNYKGNNGIWIDIFPLDNGGRIDKTSFRFKIVMVTRAAISKKMHVRINDALSKRIIVNLLTLLPKGMLVFFQKKCMTFYKNNNSNTIVNLGSQYGYKKQVHNRDFYFPATEIEFEGKNYSVPGKYCRVLETIYGSNYLELPPVEKRITHNPIRIKFSDGEEVAFNEEI